MALSAHHQTFIFSARRFPTDILRERERERERRGQKRRDLSVLYRPRAERLPEVSKSRACVVILILDDSGKIRMWMRMIMTMMVVVVVAMRLWCE